MQIHITCLIIENSASSSYFAVAVILSPIPACNAERMAIDAPEIVPVTIFKVLWSSF